MLINLPGLKTLDILIMFIGCPRRYMGLSKPQELGMNTFGISSLRRASPAILVSASASLAWTELALSFEMVRASYRAFRWKSMHPRSQAALEYHA